MNKDLDPIEELIRKKTERPFSDHIDQSFWKKFNNEFNPTPWWHKIFLTLIPLSAVSALVSIVITQTIETNPNIFLGAEIIQQQELIENIDFYSHLDELELEAEDIDLFLGDEWEG
jgi:hypothetical protein